MRLNMIFFIKFNFLWFFFILKKHNKGPRRRPYKIIKQNLRVRTTSPGIGTGNSGFRFSSHFPWNVSSRTHTDMSATRRFGDIWDARILAKTNSWRRFVDTASVGSTTPLALSRGNFPSTAIERHSGSLFAHFSPAMHEGQMFAMCNCSLQSTKESKFPFPLFSYPFFLPANVIERAYFFPRFLHTVNESCAIFSFSLPTLFIVVQSIKQHVCSSSGNVQLHIETTWFFHPIHVAPFFEAVWSFAARDFLVVNGIGLQNLNDFNEFDLFAPPTCLFRAANAGILRLSRFMIGTSKVLLKLSSWTCVLSSTRMFQSNFNSP